MSSKKVLFRLVQEKCVLDKSNCELLGTTQMFESPEHCGTAPIQGGPEVTGHSMFNMLPLMSSDFCATLYDAP